MTDDLAESIKDATNEVEGVPRLSPNNHALQDVRRVGEAVYVEINTRESGAPIATGAAWFTSAAIRVTDGESIHVSVHGADRLLRAEVSEDWHDLGPGELRARLLAEASID